MVSYLIEHLCNGCNEKIKILIHKEKISYNVMDKNFSEKKVLDYNQYIICPFCKTVNNIKITKFL